MDHLLCIFFTSFYDKSILNGVQIDAEAVLLSPSAKVQKLSQAVSIDEHIDRSEVVRGSHGLDSPEDHLKRIFGDLRVVLVNKVRSRVW